MQEFQLNCIKDDWTPFLKSNGFNKVIPNRRDSSCNYFKFAKWNANATLVLCANNDHCTRTFSPYVYDSEGQAPFSWMPVQTSNEFEPVRDACWCPVPVDNSEHGTFYYAVSKCSLPITMRDATSGAAIKTFSCCDHRDLFSAPNCMLFNKNGTRLIAGLDGRLAVYNTEASESKSRTEFKTYRKSKRSENDVGMRGVVSSLCFSPDNPQLLAASTFKSSVCVYDTSLWPGMDAEVPVTDWKTDTSALLYGSEELQCSSKTRPVAAYAEPVVAMRCNLSTPRYKGITQCGWLPDGRTLIVCGRGKDACTLKAFDIRKPVQPVFQLKTDDAVQFPMQQRVYFDIDQTFGKYLITGGAEGKVYVFDLEAASRNGGLAPEPPVVSLALSLDTVVSAALHPWFHHKSSLYRYLVAATGSRHAVCKKEDSFIGLFKI